jgi:hypothetical protein
LERVEWGRFYGTPSQFVVRYPREVPVEELRLQQALRFLQFIPYQLPSEQQQALLARLAELQADVDSLSQRLDDSRRKNIAAFRATFEQQAGGQVGAVLEGDQSVPIDQFDEAQNLIAIEEVWSEPAEVWQQFEQHHETVRRRFRQLRRLEKYDIGRVNRQIEDARLQMREAELSTGVVLISLADEFKTLELTLDALTKSRTEAQQNVQTIASQMGRDHPLTSLAEDLLRQYEQRIDQQAAPITKQSADIQQRVAAMPSPVDQAWQAFLDANRQSTIETRQINE